MSWDAPSPVPDGYEVFYQVDGGDILSAGNTTNTMLTITGVTMQQEISVFVVSFGGTNTLPSARSNVAIVPPGKSLMGLHCYCTCVYRKYCSITADHCSAS